MKVLIVTGIWPPDVGGPATHAPEVAEALRARGHDVEVVTTAATAPEQESYPVHAVPRTALRHPRTVAAIAEAARRADVVYAASMLHRAALGTSLARTPLVVKLSSDVAYERARRRGLFSGTLTEFQHARGAVPTASRALRAAALRRARHVVTPSEFLRGLAITWGVPPARVSVVPNALPVAPSNGAATFDRPTFVFAGRLTAAKALDVALAAFARVGDADLVVVGDGEERTALERRAADLGLNGRVRFLGVLPRERVLELFRGATGVVLSSAWENFPHTVVESLAAGTPVIATSVGGVPEIVVDGENGLLVAPGDPDAFAGALRRFLDDDALRERLRGAAGGSVARFAPERVMDSLERILVDAAA